jgi:hypothetical protein
VSTWNGSSTWEKCVAVKDGIEGGGWFLMIWDGYVF